MKTVLEPITFGKQKSNYTYVSWHSGNGKWCGRVYHLGKNFHGPYYSTQVEAAKSVNALCALLNIDLKHPNLGTVTLSDSVQKRILSRAAPTVTLFETITKLHILRPKAALN